MSSMNNMRAASVVYVFVDWHFFLLFSIAIAATASLEDEMFHVIFDRIRIDFACELTLLKVCIYCWLFWEQESFRLLLVFLSFGR